MAVKRRGRLHVWAMPAFLLTVVLFSLQLISAQARLPAPNFGVSHTLCTSEEGFCRVTKLITHLQIPTAPGAAPYRGYRAGSFADLD